jgi:hypothetical protein
VDRRFNSLIGTLCMPDAFYRKLKYILRGYTNLFSWDKSTVIDRDEEYLVPSMPTNVMQETVIKLYILILTGEREKKEATKRS